MKCLPYLILILIFFALPELSAQPDYLIFGKGGGLAGGVTQYRLLSSGKVYKGSGMAEILYAQKGKICRSDAKKILEDLKNLPDTTFHHPGNVYYFIQFPGDTMDVRYTWGDPDYQVPDALNELYRISTDRVARLKYKTLKNPLK